MQEASAAEAGGAKAFSCTKDGSSSDPGNDVSDHRLPEGPCGCHARRSHEPVSQPRGTGLARHEGAL